MPEKKLFTLNKEELKEHFAKNPSAGIKRLLAMSPEKREADKKRGQENIREAERAQAAEEAKLSPEERAELQKREEEWEEEMLGKLQGGSSSFSDPPTAKDVRSEGKGKGRQK